MKRDKTSDHLPVLPSPAQQPLVYGHPERLREGIGNFRIHALDKYDEERYGWESRFGRATHG